MTGHGSRAARHDSSMEKTCCNKKHPCPDCNFCQFCAEIRCIACRREKSKPKQSAEEQIRIYEELNRDRPAPGEPVLYKK